ncbi:MAG: Gfo/Idh/MocA family oxidoreductase [Cyanobacteria bacterium P01_H01_bin.119]
MASSQLELGIAVVGTGFGQKIHIPGFQTHHRTRVVGVYHRNLEKAEAIAAAHQIDHACDRVEDIVALPGVDGVAISTPPFLHWPTAEIALKAGKHVLLEKPTALSVAEAQQIQSLAQANNRVVGLDFEFRFIPAWQRLAELLAEHYVGQKRLITINWLGASRANPQRAWSWYAQSAKGGGTLGSIGSHTFDYIRWLFGPVAQLNARLTTTITKRPDPETGQLKPVDSDDTCNISLTLADGTPCQVNLSAITAGGRGHWVEIYGDRGTLVLGNDNPKDYIHGFKLWAAKAGDKLSEVSIPERLAFPQTYPDGRLAPFIRVIDHWVSDIDRGVATAPSIAEGLASQQLMDLSNQSHRTGTWITLASTTD